MTDLLLKYFREKQQAVQSEKVYDAQCPFCSMQCKLQLIEQSIVTRKEYKVVGRENPTTEGRVCIKGMNAHHHALHTERVTYPLLKVNGQFERISWERALQIVKDRFQDIQEKNGLDALSVYGGGSLTNEEAYLLGKFARVALKTKYIDYNGRFCMSAAASAANQTFGIDRGLTNGLHEIEEAECLMLVGTNLAECQPTMLHYFEQAKEKGAYIIAIDPRETPTTKMADLHMAIRPGMDAVLANGILKALLEESLLDETFLSEKTNGFEEVEAHVQEIEWSEIETMTGVPIQQIRKAAVMFGKTATGMIFTARGVEQQTDGYMAVCNFLNILLVTGKIGKKSCGYGAITGQGNGQGGREHGQKADQLPGYRSIENPEHRAYIADVWGVEESELPQKGVSAYEMMEKIQEGQIKGMLLMGSNPVVSNPNANLVKQAMQKLDFLVVIDMFISETAEMADLILPTSSYLEDEGTMTNVEGRVVYREASRPCPGEVKHDWKILSEIASALGKGEYFSYSCTEDIFNELRKASKGGVADYYGITYERIKQTGGLLWPCPELNHGGTERLFEDGFYHPDQKAAMVPVFHQPAQLKEKTDHDFPLYLTTGRVLSQYLTNVQTMKSPSLAAREFESFVDIHPQTAQKYSIPDRTLVKVESRRGSITVRSRWTENIRPDTVFIPFHWGNEQNVNKLIADELDPTCRMPGYKVSTVAIKKTE